MLIQAFPKYDTILAMLGKKMDGGFQSKTQDLLAVARATKASACMLDLLHTEKEANVTNLVTRIAATFEITNR